MGDDATIQLRKLIDPFEVPPGAKVVLERDHDPGFKGQWMNKAEGEHALRAGPADFREREHWELEAAKAQLETEAPESAHRSARAELATDRSRAGPRITQSG